MISLAELRVTDLKQYAYCPRIPFYQHVMGFTGKPTYKMERGRDAQAAIEALERRRKLREYGLAEGQRRFGCWLTSERLGLSGKLDLLIETEDACFPVDFKYTTGRPVVYLKSPGKHASSVSINRSSLPDKPRRSEVSQQPKRRWPSAKPYSRSFRRRSRASIAACASRPRSILYVGFPV